MLLITRDHGESITQVYIAACSMLRPLRFFICVLHLFFLRRNKCHPLLIADKVKCRNIGFAGSCAEIPPSISIAILYDYGIPDMGPQIIFVICNIAKSSGFAPLNCRTPFTWISCFLPVRAHNLPSHQRTRDSADVFPACLCVGSLVPRLSICLRRHARCFYIIGLHFPRIPGNSTPDIYDNLSPMFPVTGLK